VPIPKHSKRAKLTSELGDCEVEVEIPTHATFLRHTRGRVVEIEVNLGELVRAAAIAAVVEAPEPITRSGGLVFARVVG
jgi:hypothetical protein